jgi:hypothetical protein
MRSILVLSLALVPPLMAAAWTLFQMRQAERDLNGMGNFKGLHLEE